MSLIKMVLLFYSDYASVVLFCWLLYIFYQRHFHVCFFFKLNVVEQRGPPWGPHGKNLTMRYLFENSASSKIFIVNKSPNLLLTN